MGKNVVRTNEEYSVVLGARSENRLTGIIKPSMYRSRYLDGFRFIIIIYLIPQNPSSTIQNSVNMV